jgi:hypothetical protein
MRRAYYILAKGARGKCGQGEGEVTGRRGDFISAEWRAPDKSGQVSMRNVKNRLGQIENHWKLTGDRKAREKRGL